jgi:predicted nucleotidyltransferase component of viral defense system
MNEPLENRLRTPEQRNLANLQDRLVEALYRVDLDIILHGGTAIWRCYGGNRFSDDVDVYAIAPQLKKLEHSLGWELNRRGVKLEYPKYSTKRIIVFNDTARVKLEIMNKPDGLRAISKEYEKTDGTKLFVRTLKAENFIAEKISAYESRKYIRDAYDLYFLVSNLKEIKGKIKDELTLFIRSAEPPTDEQSLKDIVYSGVAPSFNEIMEYIGGRLK